MTEENESLKSTELRQTFLSRTDLSSGLHQDHDHSHLEPVLDVSDLAKDALFDDKKRYKLIHDTCKKVHSLCKICTSPFFSIYTEWMAMDEMSGGKLSTLAKECFEEEISEQSFNRHRKNHMHDPFKVRRIMIAKDPNIEPKKIIGSTIKILQQQIIDDERLDPKLLSELRNFLDLHGKYTGETKQGPQTEITMQTLNINTPGAIPDARDTTALLARELTQDEQRRLDELNKLLSNRGSAATRAQIPEKVPEVKTEDVKVVDVPWEDIERE